MRNRFAGALAIALLVSAALVSFAALVRAAEDDIGGVVTSANGPEEGVWVIAETTGLPTKFVKSVVTGDGGRYLIPDLPDATYDVWVRGYGLVDSAPVQASPGDTVDLAATVAATPGEAAAVYPANYWYSLIRPPAQDEFPGPGPTATASAPTCSTRPVARRAEAGVHALPPAREPHRPRDRQPRAVRLEPRGVEPPGADGPARRPDDQRHEPLRPDAGAADVLRLERPHRGRRGARGAAAPRGHRAERRRLDVGVGHRHRLHPRRDRHRQAQPPRSTGTAPSTGSTSRTTR